MKSDGLLGTENSSQLTVVFDRNVILKIEKLPIEIQNAVIHSKDNGLPSNPND